MPSWTADDIPWDRFDPASLSADHLKVVKAAALTEYNAGRYALYLKNVFATDIAFQAMISEWRAEEEQHGLVLGQYVEMADPSFDFQGVFRQFQDGYIIPVDVLRSVRGSLSGEFLARCIVETGTSSFYTALGEAASEPVLRAICQRIAADEYRHYRMFLDGLRRYQAKAPIPLGERIRVAVGRLREADDDELAFAFHCANPSDAVYDRAASNARYAALAYRLYRPWHLEKAVVMIFKATGLNPRGWLARLTSRAATWLLRAKLARVASVLK